jgi:hypothetical protein
MKNRIPRYLTLHDRFTENRWPVPICFDKIYALIRLKAYKLIEKTRILTVKNSTIATFFKIFIGDRDLTANGIFFMRNRNGDDR